MVARARGTASLTPTATAKAAEAAGRVGDELASRLRRCSRLLDYGGFSARNTWSEAQFILLRSSERRYRRIQ